MSEKMLGPLLDRDLIQKTISTALSNGGEWAEVFVEDRQSASTEFDEGRVESMVSSRDLGAGVRVTVGEATGFAHTADLSSEGLKEAALAAAAALKEGTRLNRSRSVEKESREIAPRSYLRQFQRPARLS
jgi:TldD protein